MPTIDIEEESGPIRVSLGRGVASWVNGHGGRLYVWGDPFSEAFDTVNASIERPSDVDFVPCDAVGEFELFVEAGMSFGRGVHLGRRWFGLRDGVSADTGFVIAGGM